MGSKASKRRRNESKSQPQDAPRPKARYFTPATIALTLVLGGAAGMLIRSLFPGSPLVLPEETPKSVDQPNEISEALKAIPFNAARAYDYLEQLCEIGPRPSGSPGMAQQQKLLTEHFEKLGAKVVRQTFQARHPLTGDKVEMTNLIVQWHPETTERILLCAHYDTRPYPDRDLKNKDGVFVGANDGASGVALLMAMGDEMHRIECKYGVDMVLFDGEEFVFRFGQQRGEYFVGSEHFAHDYLANMKTGTQPYTYVWGVLVDMIGDKHLRIYREINSNYWDDTRPLVDQIWGTAARLGATQFDNRERHEIRDDHLPLHNIAQIPCIDIIDFDYLGYWHTTEDTPDKCSGESLAIVGRVLLEWLKTVP